MTCSCSRSPPFSRELRILFWHPPLYPYHNIDHHPGEKVVRPAPPFRLALAWNPLLMITLVNARGVFAIQLTTIEVGPGARIPSFRFTFASFFSSSSPPLWPPPAESKVIQIQSDHLLAASPPGCCHGTVQSDLSYPSLLKKPRAPSGRPPLTFSRSSLDSLLAGFLFFFLILDVALLHKQRPHLRDRQVTMVV